MHRQYFFDTISVCVWNYAIRIERSGADSAMPENKNKNHSEGALHMLDTERLVCVFLPWFLI